MVRLFRAAHRHITRPLVETAVLVVDTHRNLWGRDFSVTWESLDLKNKLAWIYFVSHTVGIVSILEVFLLRKR
ncbi:hypothetical protein HY947_01290 [Candidatus Gottesmanbacteria bacterium]|nr:hypothetical protein [Candidatus Gottesmanbacteria bacterium]